MAGTLYLPANLAPQLAHEGAGVGAPHLPRHLRPHQEGEGRLLGAQLMASQCRALAASPTTLPDKQNT